MDGMESKSFGLIFIYQDDNFQVAGAALWEWMDKALGLRTLSLHLKLLCAGVFGVWMFSSHLNMLRGCFGRLRGVCVCCLCLLPVLNLKF
jgi:hypothetical protein